MSSTTSKPELAKTVLELPKHSLKQTEKLHRTLASHCTLDSLRLITHSSPRAVETQDSQTFHAANLLTMFAIIIAMQPLSPCRDRDDLRTAYTVAISPGLKRHVGCCQTTDVTPQAAIVLTCPKERCIKSETTSHSPEKPPAHTKTDFHFQDIRSFAPDRSCGRGSRL